MLHRMGLYGEYFQSIIKGKKKVEVRLNDEKRRKIQVGDEIEFVKMPEHDETLVVKVTELRSFASFKEMYENIPSVHMKFILQSRRSNGELWQSRLDMDNEQWRRDPLLFFM